VLIQCCILQHHWSFQSLSGYTTGMTAASQRSLVDGAPFLLDGAPFLTHIMCSNTCCCDSNEICSRLWSGTERLPAAHLHRQRAVQTTIHICPDPLVVSIIPYVHREAEPACLHCVDIWETEGVCGLQQSDKLANRHKPCHSHRLINSNCKVALMHSSCGCMAQLTRESCNIAGYDNMVQETGAQQSCMATN
jgi:hypothetical protein